MKYWRWFWEAFLDSYRRARAGESFNEARKKK